MTIDLDATPGLRDTSPRDLVRYIDECVRESERWVDRECLNLYAGTNIQSPAVRAALATTLNGRPSLGDPGDKYEMGLAFSDRVERLASDVLRTLFHAAFVEHRVLSGSMANLYVYLATCAPGDAIFAMPAAAAGHASHLEVGVAGRHHLRVHPIACVPGTHLVDADRLAGEVRRVRPRLIVLGNSLPLRPFDIGAVRDIARSVGARVMYDAAHVAGIIAGGRFQAPLREGADLMTGSTYKTFGGPAGGFVATNDPELARRLRDIAYPGMTANFDMARVAGTAVAGLELLEFGQAYADQCLRNAARLSEGLRRRGLPVWSPDGGDVPTRSHLVALRAEPWGGGTRAARACEPGNVLFSGIPLPVEWSGPDYAGIRLGVQEITRWGMKDDDAAEVAALVADALDPDADMSRIRARVRELRAGFADVRYTFDGEASREAGTEAER